MVNVSFPIFPNCRIMLSFVVAGSSTEGSTAAISWKFLIEGTVTRSLKSRHGACTRWFHTGVLFLRSSLSSTPSGDTKEFEGFLFHIELITVEKGFLFVHSEKSVGVGAVPPSRIEEAGIECNTQ